jgi:hypothetical protein
LSKRTYSKFELKMIGLLIFIGSFVGSVVIDSTWVALGGLAVFCALVSWATFVMKPD